jgi:hypothetical protein
MIFNRKSLPLFLGLMFLGAFVGSLGWEVVERIVQAAGNEISLSLATPVSLDLHVFALAFRPNLGTLVGGIGGIILFFLL